MMSNIPEVRLGIIAVSRDCFPIGLSIARREAIVKQCRGGLYECPVTVDYTPKQWLIKTILFGWIWY